MTSVTGEDGGRGTWVTALSLMKHEPGKSITSMLQGLCHDCTAAEALKFCIDSIETLKPGFAMQDYLQTFIPTNTTSGSKDNG